MPEASAHIAKAEHNEKFAAVVRELSTEFLDWVVPWRETELRGDRSETARYDTRLFSWQDIDANLIPKFDAFKNEALSLLSSWK